MCVSVTSRFPVLSRVEIQATALAEHHIRIVFALLRKLVCGGGLIEGRKQVLQSLD